MKSERLDVLGQIWNALWVIEQCLFLQQQTRPIILPKTNHLLAVIKKSSIISGFTSKAGCCSNSEVCWGKEREIEMYIYILSLSILSQKLKIKKTISKKKSPWNVGEWMSSAHTPNTNCKRFILHVSFNGTPVQHCTPTSRLNKTHYKP